MVDTCVITDTSECPDRISIDFNTSKPSQQPTPRYSVQWTLILVPLIKPAQWQTTSHNGHLAIPTINIDKYQQPTVAI